MLTKANASEFGCIKAYNTNNNDTQAVHIDANGYLYTKPSNDYILPRASDTLGGVKANNATSNDTQAVHIDTNGYLWTQPSNNYVLPRASSTLGGVKAYNKADTDTQAVRIDGNGYLWTQPATSSTNGYSGDVSIVDQIYYYRHVIYGYRDILHFDHGILTGVDSATPYTITAVQETI